MNAARLARRWQEAGDDRVAMAKALVDEVEDTSTGLVSRDYLRAELERLRFDLSSHFWRTIPTVFGVQIALVGVLVAILIQTLSA